MKAAYIEKFGGPEVLTYGTLPDPVAATGQVVVDIVAASVNGADFNCTHLPALPRRDFNTCKVKPGW